MKKIITRTIWIISFVSLFTDMASEMLYPIMPVFLRSIGFSVLLIGMLEGTAEAVAGLSKGYFGRKSDLIGKRLPFVQLGYALSAISKPLMAVFVYPLWIFFARTIDRLGKGVRAGARDALLSDESTKATKGRVFGFHRSMDTLGAVFGPLIALLYLYYHPGDYNKLFLLAFVPGMVAVCFTYFIRERPHEAKMEKLKERVNKVIIFSYWKDSSVEYKRLVIPLLAFALFNSSDAFLLLKMKESGLPDTFVIAAYIFYNLIYALLAYPIGILADKLGLKRIFIFGITIFAIVYFGFAMNNVIFFFFVFFALYALYAAATEGVSKAWISNIVPKEDTATAIGTFAGLQSISALLASTLTGLLWLKFGSSVTFIITGSATLPVIIYLWLYTPSPKK